MNSTLEKVRDAASGRLEGDTRLFRPVRNQLREDLTALRPRAYVCFTWSSEFWSRANGRVFGDESGEFDHGIVFATRSQRLAEPKKIDFTFRSGDYNRFLLVLHMDKLEADIGRKSLDRRVTNLGNLIAEAFHNDFVANSDALAPAPSRTTERDERDLENLIESAMGEGRELSIPSVVFQKEPREEQDVVALFFNLIGAGHLKGFRFFSTHISQRYDGVGYFELEKSSNVLYD